MSNPIRWTAILLLAVACRTTAPAPPPPSPADLGPQYPRAVRWVRASAEYRAVILQTFRLAGERLEEVTWDLEPGTWAVVLDADDTVIDNSLYQKEISSRGEVYTPETWEVWVNRLEAVPLPGVLDFLQLVREKGGRIAIVTNRDQEYCELTEDNFRRHSIPFDLMLCRREGNSDKRPRWGMVETGEASSELPALKIVMWLGDNINDFPDLDQDLRFASEDAFDSFGDTYFILPNPMYGSWRNNPVE